MNRVRSGSRRLNIELQSENIDLPDTRIFSISVIFFLNKSQVSKSLDQKKSGILETRDREV